MASSLSKKLLNAQTFRYLAMLPRHLPTDLAAAKEDQNKKVHILMQSAWKIPFYRKRFAECGLSPDDFHSSEDLSRFPTLTKDDLRTWMKELYDQNPDRRDSWDATSTSGSTGVPLTLYQSQREHAFANANWIRILMTFGYDPFFGKMVSFESSYRKQKSSRDSFIQRLGILQRRIISEKRCVGDETRGVIEELNEYAPDLIVLRKNCIVRIALYAQEHGLTLRQPKWYIPVSEMVDEVTRNILEKTFGPGLVDAYGSDETGSCAIKYPGKDYFHVMNDTHVINLYDENGRLSDRGTMILTPLYKTDFPIINYEIGDLATSFSKEGIRFIREIQGRLNDLVRHENGDTSSVLELRKITNGITGIAQFRFTQDSWHHMNVELVRDPKDLTYSREQIEAYFLEKLHQIYGDEFAYDFAWPDVIPPDPNGKLRCFVCNVK